MAAPKRQTRRDFAERPVRADGWKQWLLTLRCSSSRGCWFQGEGTVREQQAHPQDPHLTRVTTHSTRCAPQALQTHSDRLTGLLLYPPRARARPAAWRTLPQTHLEFLFYFLRSFCRPVPPHSSAFYAGAAPRRGYRSLLALFNQERLCCRTPGANWNRGGGGFDGKRQAG